MRFAISAAVLALIGTVFAPPSLAADGHKIVLPQEVKWSPGPAALPEGAEMSVLYGDPSKGALFAMRLKMPQGYQIPPHTHPRPEVVTVISGTFRLGMGEEADPNKAKALPAGSLFTVEPGTAHYASADEDTIVQVNSVGPFGIEYINPEDDPRPTR